MDSLWPQMDINYSSLRARFGMPERGEKRRLVA